MALDKHRGGGWPDQSKQLISRLTTRSNEMRHWGVSSSSGSSNSRGELMVDGSIHT